MWPFKKDNTIELAMRQHCEDVKTIQALTYELNKLRTENFAREAINRFCPPELLSSAMNWLREKNL